MAEVIDQTSSRPSPLLLAPSGGAMTISQLLDVRVLIDSDAVFRELDGEAVILDLKTGLYFGLNEVGARIWQLIDAHGDLRRVFAILREEFDVADGQLQHDLVTLVEQLREKGLVRVEPQER